MTPLAASLQPGDLDAPCGLRLAVRVGFTLRWVGQLQPAHPRCRWAPRSCHPSPALPWALLRLTPLTF